MPPKKLPIYRNTVLPGTDDENGENSDEPAKDPQPHIPWKNCRSQVLLLQWLKAPDHYNEYKCGKTMQNGKRRSRGKTKTAVLNETLEYLRDNGIDFRTVVMVKNKIKSWEDKWKKAYDYLKSTGEGLTTEDEKMGIKKISEQVRKLCPLWDDLHPVFSQRPGMAAVYVGESWDGADAEILLDMGKDDANEPSEIDDTAVENEEDHRGYGDLRLDGKIDSDGENVMGKKAKRARKGGRGSGEEKTKGGLAEVLLVLDKKRDERDTAKDKHRQLRLEIMEKKVDLKHEFQMAQLEMQREQLNVQKEEQRLRQLEAENERMRLQIELEKVRGELL